MDTSNSNPNPKRQPKPRSCIVDYKAVPMQPTHVPCEGLNQGKIRCRLCWLPLKPDSPDLRRPRGQRMTDHFCRWNIANDARPPDHDPPMYHQPVFRRTD